MFTSIFNWLISRAPSFVRPAVNWLIEGLRNITNHISARWNALGTVVALWFWGAVHFGGRFGNLARRVAWFAGWVREIYIPNFVWAAIGSAVRAVNTAIAAVRALALSGLEALRRFTLAAVNKVTGALSALQTFATAWIDRIRAGIATLINALRHVLNGPAALAEWLAGHMAKALLRFVFAQRDRIAVWLTRESVVFTRWLAAALEDVIVRYWL